MRFYDLKCTSSHKDHCSNSYIPGHDIICELPSLRHIRNCCTLLLRTTNTLAAYQLGKERSWKQLHTNETGRQQKQLVNVVINIINESGDFKSICLSGSIIAEDSTAEEQSRSIIASFGEAGQLLHEWKDVTLKMFPRRQDLIDMIPDPSDMSPTKLLGGIPVPEGADIDTLCWTRMGGGIPSMVKRGIHIHQTNCSSI
jgi:hypothetical protein